MKKFVHSLLRSGESPDSPAVRARLGSVGSVTGMAVNALLAAAKFLAGVMTGSVAITADAANNLSDAARSVVSLITMRLAVKPVDRDHPFGHGRYEYLGALGVGVLILVMAFELLSGGVNAILHPELPQFSWGMMAILALSVLAKVLLGRFDKALGGLIDASALIAAGQDALSDALATSAVMAGMLVGHFFHLPVDGVLGVAVALLVFKAGWGVCKETVDSLLGGKPDQALGRQITQKIESYPHILGTHDLIIHDYGPGRCFASIHAEVPASGSIIELHEIIDRAEQEILAELNVPVCIHMDPIVTGDAQTDYAMICLSRHLKSLGDGFLLHDLRLVPGEERINLVFDVAVPAGYSDTHSLEASLQDAARKLDERYRCVIHFDVDYYHQ